MHAAFPVFRADTPFGAFCVFIALAVISFSAIFNSEKSIPSPRLQEMLRLSVK